MNIGNAIGLTARFVGGFVKTVAVKAGTTAVEQYHGLKAGLIDGKEYNPPVEDTPTVVRRATRKARSRTR